MSDVSIPNTPTPGDPTQHPSMATTSANNANYGVPSNGRYHSPPTTSIIDLTPPPSSQIPKSIPKSNAGASKDQPLVSPPATLKIGPPIVPPSNSTLRELPTLDDVARLSEDQLRGLVTELLPALGAARMAAAHSKLQYSLLSIENVESGKRAAVEHELTRREVEVLQTGSPRMPGRGLHGIDHPGSPYNSSQRRLDLALKHTRNLEADNVVLDRRLRQAKKVIKQLDGKVVQLSEDNHLLRQRIKQNRDHLDAIRSLNALSSAHETPLIEHRSPSHRQTPRQPVNLRSAHVTNSRAGTQDLGLDALLAAAEVQSGETNSVPSSPTLSRRMKLHPIHTRGTHSLSSLPATPSRSRPVTADAFSMPVDRSTSGLRSNLSAPKSHITYDESNLRREDRDSTISVSDNEEAYTDEDVPASQASKVATSMLRSSVSLGDVAPGTEKIPETKTMVQGKLFGYVKKPMSGTNKRGGSREIFKDQVQSNKKARVHEVSTQGVGLGIRSWPSPSH